MSTIYSVQHAIIHWLTVPQLRWVRLSALLAMFLLVSLAGAATVQSHTIPTISIVSVKQDESVTIRTYNFPAGYDFVVTMGYMGTAGIGGTVVTRTPSGNGGSFDVTYPIPHGLHGQYQIAIRLQTEHLYPYYAFNWFYNNTTGVAGEIGKGAQQPPATPNYTGIPTFRITAVEQDKTVTIETNNFPANQDFALTMGAYGTLGIGGTFVKSFNSGAGGTFSQTFDIPAAYHGSHRIAIRAQTAHANPYFAYNWFFNASTGQGGKPETTSPNTPTVIPTTPVFQGVPTFKVCGVMSNGTVTIVTSELPANQTFVVKMGAMYTQGIEGMPVGNFNSGDGTVQRLTYPIPSELHGAYRISMRFETTDPNLYYAYNWFYNNTTTVC